MGKDYLKLYVKVLLRHGKELEALQHLINNGIDMVDAQIMIINLKELIADEQDD